MSESSELRVMSDAEIEKRFNLATQGKLKFVRTIFEHGERQVWHTGDSESQSCGIQAIDERCSPKMISMMARVAADIPPPAQ